MMDLISSIPAFNGEKKVLMLLQSSVLFIIITLLINGYYLEFFRYFKGNLDYLRILLLLVLFKHYFLQFTIIVNVFEHIISYDHLERVID